MLEIPETELTPSLPTNLLLKAVTRLLEGEAGEREAHLEEFSNLLNQRLSGLAEAKADFNSRISAEPEEFLQEFGPEIEEINQGFAEYEAALQELEKFLENPQSALLQKGSDRLIPATLKLTGALQRFDARYLVWGKERFPLLNALEKIVQGIKNQTLFPDLLTNMKENAGLFNRKAMAELENLAEPGTEESLQTIKTGYQEFNKGMEELEKFARDQNSAHLEAGLKTLKISQETIEAGFAQYGEQLYLTSPTPIPAANLMLNTIKGVKAGYFDAALLSSALEKLELSLLKMKKQLETFVSFSIDSETVRRELPELIGLFDLMEEGKDKIKAYLKQPAPELLESGENLLKEGAEKIAVQQKKILEMIEQAARINCLSCNYSNPLSQKVCEKCGAVLPKKFSETLTSTFQIKEGADQELVPTGMVMTQNIQRLVEAAHNVAAQKISKEEFVQTLNWLENLAQQTHSKLAKLPKYSADNLPETERERTASEKELLDETVELLNSGLEQVKAGLAQMAKYLEDDQKDHLTLGLKQVMEGSQSIYQVQQIGAIARKAQAEQKAEGKPEEIPVPRESFQKSEE